MICSLGDHSCGKVPLNSKNECFIKYIWPLITESSLPECYPEVGTISRENVFFLTLQSARNKRFYAFNLKYYSSPPSQRWLTEKGEKNFQSKRLPARKLFLTWQKGGKESAKRRVKWIQFRDQDPGKSQDTVQWSWTQGATSGDKRQPSRYLWPSTLLQPEHLFFSPCYRRCSQEAFIQKGELAIFKTTRKHLIVKWALF